MGPRIFSGETLMRPMTRGDLGISPAPSPADRFPIICMLKEEFERLPEYSATWPTGVVPGKRWRRHDGAHDFKSLEPPVWFVLEYGPLETFEEHGLTKQGCRTIWYRPILSREMVAGDL